MLISIGVVFALVGMSIVLLLLDRLRSRMVNRFDIRINCNKILIIMLSQRRMEKLLGHLPGPKPNPIFGHFFELVKKKAYAKAFDQFIPQYGDIVSYFI